MPATPEEAAPRRLPPAPLAPGAPPRAPSSPGQPASSVTQRWRIVASRPVNVLLASLLVLNLFDAVLTLLWVTLELTTEENPFMEVALNRSPVLFMLVKMLLVSLAAVLINRGRHRRDVLWASWLIVAFYYFVAVNHAWFYGDVLLPAMLGI